MLVVIIIGMVAKKQIAIAQYLNRGGNGAYSIATKSAVKQG